MNYLRMMVYMENKPENTSVVSIVIINHNGKNQIEECLRSFFAHTPGDPFEPTLYSLSSALTKYASENINMQATKTANMVFITFFLGSVIFMLFVMISILILLRIYEPSLALDMMRRYHMVKPTIYIKSLCKPSKQ